MRRKLGEILVSAGLVSAAEVDMALVEQTYGDQNRVGEILVAQGLITPEQLARALSVQHAVPYVEVPFVPPPVLELIPIELQQRHRLVPFRVDGDRISVAVAEPGHEEAIAELRASLPPGQRVVVYVASAQDVDAVLSSQAVAPPTTPDGPLDAALFGDIQFDGQTVSSVIPDDEVSTDIDLTVDEGGEAFAAVAQESMGDVLAPEPFDTSVFAPPPRADSFQPFAEQPVEGWNPDLATTAENPAYLPFDLPTENADAGSADGVTPPDSPADGGYELAAEAAEFGAAAETPFELASPVETPFELAVPGEMPFESAAPAETSTGLDDFFSSPALTAPTAEGWAPEAAPQAPESEEVFPLGEVVADEPSARRVGVAAAAPLATVVLDDHLDPNEASAPPVAAPVVEPAEPVRLAAVADAWTSKLDDVPPSRLIVAVTKALVRQGLITEADILKALERPT